MIKPDKFTNIDNSLIGISSKILLILKNFRLIELSKLELMLKNEVNVSANEYKYSLDLLFCLGLVNYTAEEDRLELICNEVN